MLIFYAENTLNARVRPKGCTMCLVQQMFHNKSLCEKLKDLSLESQQTNWSRYT